MPTLGRKAQAALILITSLSTAAHDKHKLPPVPRIEVRPFSAEQISQQVKQEHLDLQYLRAAQIARSVYRQNGCKVDYAELTGKFAVDLGISPRIIAGLVFTESSCRPDVESPTHDIGLMQVHYPLYRTYTREQLKSPELNMRVGCGILKGYIKQYGLQEGLHRYNGLGDKTDTYSTKVLSAASM
jgi:soluble lytic murein transglycosylase-like protein